MGQELNVPIYINGNSNTQSDRELYLEDDTLKHGEQRSGIKVAESLISDETRDVTNSKLNTKTSNEVGVDGTWKPLDGKTPTFNNIGINNNDTQLNKDGIIILNDNMYGTSLPSQGSVGQLFFVIQPN